MPRHDGVGTHILVEACLLLGESAQRNDTLSSLPREFGSRAKAEFRREGADVVISTSGKMTEQMSPTIARS